MNEKVHVEVIDDEADFAHAYRCASEAFGRQAQDAIWIATNPNWDSAQGQKEGAARLADRWQQKTTNMNGQSNTVFLKATLVNPKLPGQGMIAGFAIWQQVSVVQGWGDSPNDDLGSVALNMDPVERRFAEQMVRGLHARRTMYAKEKADQSPPAIFTLDLCVVDPGFQRKGIATKLVQWGLDEARKRGDLECTTEASSMGRGVYLNMGFRAEGEVVQDMVFEVDDEFRDRDKPSNVFLRTGRSSQ